MGLCMSAFFICSCVFIIIWNYLVQVYGKKECWKAYSIIGAIFFNLFLFCDGAHPKFIVFTSAICSMASSGSFINDAIISDIIEYDEFLTGHRNEGVFCVISTIVPKFVSIFSQSIPIVLLSSKIY